MKVKVTSAGITQKGTSTHHLINTRYLGPTLSSLSSDTPTITIPRVPSKPPTSSSRSSSSHSSSSSRDQSKRHSSSGSSGERSSHHKSKSITLVRDTFKIPQVVVTSSTPSRKVTTVHVPVSTSSSTSSKYASTSKSRSQTATTTKSSAPGTQAIRIALPSTKKTTPPAVLPPKQRKPPPDPIVINRKSSSIKEITTTSTTTTVTTTTTATSTTREVKQVFVKHVPITTPPVVARNIVKPPYSQVQLASKSSTSASSVASKKFVPVVRRKVVSTKPVKKEKEKAPSKPATKRKADPPTPKVPTKMAKPSTSSSTSSGTSSSKSTSKTIKVTDVPEFPADIGNEVEIEIIYDKPPPLPATITAPVPEPRPLTKKKKHRKKTWKVTTPVKQSSSNILFYGSTSGVITDPLGNEEETIDMPFSKAEKDWIVQQSLAPVAGEIKDILHAFGDSCDPLIGTVQIMEEVVVHEVCGFIRVCEQKAKLRGVKTLGILEAILALKRNIPRVDRLYHYFGYHDVYDRKVFRVNKFQDKSATMKQFVTKEIQNIIKDFNLTDLLHLLHVGLDDIETSLSGIADSKLEDAVRSNSDMLKFYQYAKIRSLSFARKLTTVNLKRAIVSTCHVHNKMTDTFGSVLDFFILDFMAEIVDCAFDIRKERLGSSSDPRVANPDTCMSAPFFFKKRKDDRCNQVSEILVQASEMEATRLKKETRRGDVGRRWPDAAGPVSNPVVILYPSYVREAYMRIQTDTRRPTRSFPTQACLTARHF